MGRPQKPVHKLSIHKGSWRCFYRDPVDGVLREKYFGKAEGPDPDQVVLRQYASLVERVSAGLPVSGIGSGGLTIGQMVDQFLEHAEAIYQPRSVAALGYSLRGLLALFVDTPAADFGPRKLVDVQAWEIARGRTRPGVKGVCGNIRKVFRWAVSMEMVPPGVLEALRSVPPPRPGMARDTKPKGPVSDEIVEKTLAKIAKVPGMMVRLARLSGMRPGEVESLAWEEIDRSREREGVWIVRKTNHKNAWRGKSRTIILGPRSIELLRPLAKESGSVFAREKKSMAAAIRIACKKAKVPAWSPNQLRKAKATSVLEDFNIDHARAVLGHSTATVTSDHYAREDLRKAIEVAKRTS